MALILAGCPGRGSDKEVVAKVNSYKILRSELDKNYNGRIAGAPQKPTAAEEEALRLNILSQLIDIQLHLQKAEKLGILATDDEVESKFAQGKAPYTQEEFQKRLKDLGITGTIPSRIYAGILRSISCSTRRLVQKLPSLILICRIITTSTRLIST